MTTEHRCEEGVGSLHIIRHLLAEVVLAFKLWTAFILGIALTQDTPLVSVA